MNTIGDRATETLESMEMDDEDEGIADTGDRFRNNVLPTMTMNWSFANVPSRIDDEIPETPQQIAAPPGSDQDCEENLFDDDSTKAVSASSETDRHFDFPDDHNEDDRPQVIFTEDEGTTRDVFESYRSGSTPVQDMPPLIESDYDPAVAEVRVGEGDEMFPNPD